MNDAQLLRYSRQIMLPQIDIDGQERLLAARALIIGAGGLGSPAAMYLAAAGIGHLVIADPDRSSCRTCNANCYITITDIGRNKADSAARLTETAESRNPGVADCGRHCRVRQLDEQVRLADCRARLQRQFRHPLCRQPCLRNTSHPAGFRRGHSYGGAACRIRLKTLKTVPATTASTRKAKKTTRPAADNGVLSPLVGIIGSLQALEAIKVHCRSR